QPRPSHILKPSEEIPQDIYRPLPGCAPCLVEPGPSHILKPSAEIPQDIYRPLPGCAPCLVEPGPCDIFEPLPEGPQSLDGPIPDGLKGLFAPLQHNVNDRLDVLLPDIRHDISDTEPVVLPCKVKPDNACYQEPYREKSYSRKSAEESSNSTDDALIPMEYASDCLTDRDDAGSRLRKQPDNCHKPQDSTCT